MFVAAHLTVHNDFKLIKLARDFGFPRGFCLVVDVQTRQLIGQGTFYPKFANDDRNVSFSAKDFGNISKISCFLKYSGSTGIVTILRDGEGNVIGWTGSSKNSCNHSAPADGGISYPSETVAAFSKFATFSFLRYCQKHRITSLGLEVFIARDQTHGYGYTKTGCIVIAMCAEGAVDGRPVYLNPHDLYEACSELDLPTDRPTLVEGKQNIQSFVGTLSDLRDFITLSALRRILHERCGIALDTLHDSLIDSEIVEGFVIRRWRGEVEVESVKFKIWLYQMVTQVLRPSLSSKGMNGARGEIQSLKSAKGELRPEFLSQLKEAMRKWCVSSDPATQRLCRWVVLKAAEACLPDGHEQLQWSAGSGCDMPCASELEGCVARDASRAYWITLGQSAVNELISVMDIAEWDPQRAAAALADGC